MKPRDSRSQSGCHFQSPVRGSGGRFEPALGRQDVGAAVAIHVARADAVAVTVRADHVLDEGAVFELVPGERRVVLAELRQHLALLAVVIEVDQKDELDRPAVFDGVLLPVADAAAGIFHPVELFGELGAAHDVERAVAVDVDRQVAEIVDVVVAVS